MANRPIHEIRLGKVKAAIWRNETDSGVRYSVALVRIFRTDNGWEIGPEIGAGETVFAGHTDVGRGGSTERATHFKQLTGGAPASQDGCEPDRLEIPRCPSAPMAIRPAFRFALCTNFTASIILQKRAPAWLPCSASYRRHAMRCQIPSTTRDAISKSPCSSRVSGQDSPVFERPVNSTPRHPNSRVTSGSSLWMIDASGPVGFSQHSRSASENA
jgi:hypothetical protein